MAFFCSAYSNAQTIDAATGQLIPGQEYSTGNIVTPTTTDSGSTWAGAVYQDSLTCWGWGDPGYCGPSPIVRPGGNINFSFGSSYIFQEQSLTGILPPVPGLNILGYNFSFTAKNGNGWDDGRTDQLTALVRFWDTTGGRASNNLLHGNSWDLSYRYNWTTFNFGETFTTPLAASSIGRVQYGFIGRDNNGWAGPYGPEINNVSFGLRYGVDPCSVNPLSSPTCPGYLEAMSRYTVIPAVTYELAPTMASSTVAEEPVVVMDVITGTAVSATGAAPTAAQSAVQATTQTQTSVAATRERGAGPSTSQLLSIIRAEQNRLGAVESAVTQQSQQQSQQAAQDAQSQSDRQASQSASQSAALANSTLPGSVTAGASTITGTAVNTPGAAVNILSAATPVETPVEPQPTNTARRQVQDNDAAAGGVSLASLQVVPIGFSAYQTALQDAAFYAPKEIYRAQRTVDNQRLLRGLTQGSDRLHEQMVDQQYQPRN